MSRRIIWKRFLSTLLASTLLAVLLVLPASAAVTTAIRELPTSVASGAEFEITITPSGCGIFGQVIETLPAGFTYFDCIPSDIGVEKTGNSIRFTFVGSENFTYRVKAPVVTATASYTFHGIVRDENKVEYPIEDSSITVTAPTPVTYSLTILLQGNGSTTPSPLTSHDYDAGEEVEISAIPASGWQFDGWGGDVTNPSSLSTTVTMDKDKTIVAKFSEIALSVYTLSLICEPPEGGEVLLTPLASANQYQANTFVTLTATPADGYAFSGWGGDLNGSDDSITIVMDSNKNVTANFAPLEKSTGFIVSSLSVLPEKVTPEQTVHILVNIANSSGKAENYQAFLYINGSLEDARIIQIPAYSSENVVFNATRLTPGTYTVSIGDKQGKFVVEGKESLFNRLGIVNPVTIVIIAALIAALVFILRKIKKRA
jgi:uncharacterized repeat protein (TIGR02543 family)